MANDGLSSSQRNAVIRRLRKAADELAQARLNFATEMLLAKLQRREGNPVTDEMAKMMATIATNDAVTIKEVNLMIWKNALEKGYDTTDD